MANYKVTDSELTSVANAIRTKGGTSAQLEFPDEFVSAIQAISTSSSSGIGTYMRGNLIGEYDNRSPSAGGVGGVWTSTGHDTSDDIGFIVDYYYNDNLIKTTLILKDKVLPSGAPNTIYENFGTELNSSGGNVPQAAFNVKITDNIMFVSFGAQGIGEYVVKFYTAVNSGISHAETVSHYAWHYNGWAGWAVMKKLDGAVIGKNVDQHLQYDLIGDLIKFTYYGDNVAPIITALVDVSLKIYQTSKTSTSEITSIVQTLTADQTLTLQALNYDGGYYIEATAVISG